MPQERQAQDDTAVSITAVQDQCAQDRHAEDKAEDKARPAASKKVENAGVQYNVPNVLMSLAGGRPSSTGGLDKPVLR